MDKELIKVNGNIRESKRVNVVFDILHMLCNCPITLLKTSKIWAINHDLSVKEKGICLLEGDPRSSRCDGGGEKQHKRGRDGSNNCIKKQLILSKP